MKPWQGLEEKAFDITGRDSMFGRLEAGDMRSSQDENPAGSFSRVNWKDNLVTYDREKMLKCAHNFVGWIHETEERAIIEALAKNGCKDALLKLRSMIDKALEMEKGATIEI